MLRNREGFRNLQAGDALVLQEPLLTEAEELLPMPAAAAFWLHDPARREEHGFSPEQENALNILTEQRATARVTAEDGTDSAPRILEDMLVIPLTPAEESGADLVIYNIDPTMLRKMSAAWLDDLQEKMLQRFAHTRLIYIDPATDLYNQRALELLLSAGVRNRTLFLIAAVSGTRTISGGFQKLRQVTSRLRRLSPEPLFYFGPGLFGLISRHSERDTCLNLSHHLISRLKREGLRRVHIGFSRCREQDSVQDILNRCQLILSEAERRGPYSLCDDTFLRRKEQHPFALPPAPILRRIRKAWNGLDRFGLILVSFPAGGRNNEEPPDLTPLLPSFCCSFPLSSCQLLLLPDYPAGQVKKQAHLLADKIEQQAGSRIFIGFCHWPSAGLSKVDCIRSCRKAILHAAFYGSGAVVEFNALTYNISGDLYFDEGDYKQAIREYRAGLHLKPNHINLLNSLGVALAETGRHREAVVCFSRALAIEPENYMALINKGMSCRVLGRNNEATVCFEQGLRCKEHKEHAEQASIEVYLQLGRLYCLQEQFDRAVSLLAELRRLQGEPGEFIFFLLLGEACMGAGQNREAIRALQRSLQIYPQNADSQSMLGLLYILEGQGEEVGLSLCDRAVAADSSDARHLYRRGAALHHLKRHAEALQDVRAALKRQRNNEQALLLRAILYEELGSLRRARQTYQRIISMKNVTEHRKDLALAGLDRLRVKKITARTQLANSGAPSLEEGI
ncbi:MAG: tetratricopeptide repeat protein [Candidatus Electrothrix sp. YB6]